jgi:hypothetical protein
MGCFIVFDCVQWTDHSFDFSLWHTSAAFLILNLLLQAHAAQISLPRIDVSWILRRKTRARTASTASGPCNSVSKKTQSTTKNSSVKRSRRRKPPQSRRSGSDGTLPSDSDRDSKGSSPNLHNIAPPLGVHSPAPSGSLLLSDTVVCRHCRAGHCGPCAEEV